MSPPICPPYIYIVTCLPYPPRDWRAVQGGLPYPGRHLVKHSGQCTEQAGWEHKGLATGRLCKRRWRWLHEDHRRL
jgi:hypothetical protein